MPALVLGWSTEINLGSSIDSRQNYGTLSLASLSCPRYFFKIMSIAAPEIVEAKSEVFAELAAIEAEVDRLVERYAQVAPIVREELAARRKVLKSRATSPEVKQELQMVEDHIAKLDKELQSQLVTVEVFWSAVRFGGLGLLIGWGLKAWLG